MLLSQTTSGDRNNNRYKHFKTLTHFKLFIGLTFTHSQLVTQVITFPKGKEYIINQMAKSIYPREIIAIKVQNFFITFETKINSLFKL